MAVRDIIRNMILRPGQSQEERIAPELGVHHADVDERTPEDFLAFAGRLADLISFYGDGISEPSGDWTGFFPPSNLEEANRLVHADSGDIPPHLALFIAFLELYRKPQEVLNRFTGNHLDFYYRDILRFSEKPPRPDRAHLLLELKKRASPVMIGPEHLFSAGKDAGGQELVYAPRVETIVNASSIRSLRSVFIDRRGPGTVRYAPIADSADGVGGELGGADPSWNAFGCELLPPAETGFALSSPVLRMKEGTRTIEAKLLVDGLPPSVVEKGVAGAFEIFLTGEKQWLGPYTVLPSLGEGSMTFQVSLPEAEKAVTDYRPAVHGYDYAAAAPVMKILLKPEQLHAGYATFERVTLKSASVAVDVSGVTSLQLENDAGALDPKKPFLPFGPQPSAGARFMVGCSEALQKRLSKLAVSVEWKDVPAGSDHKTDLETYYEGYDNPEVTNAYFTTSISCIDGGGRFHSVPKTPLFGDDATGVKSFSVISDVKPVVSAIASEGMRIRALESAGTVWARRLAKTKLLKRPVYSSSRHETPEPRPGAVVFSLDKDFLYVVYRQKQVKALIDYATDKAKYPDGPPLPNEPYTPAIRKISLSYHADSGEIPISSTAIDDYSSEEIRFFHIGYFGQMREHGFQRDRFPFLDDKRVSLFPRYACDGELLIGIAGLEPGDSVSLLFQAAEGTNDPDLDRANISWGILCDNYWKPLGTKDLVLDTTDHLLSTGIIRFLVPAEATTENTILPSGCIWIKGGVAKNVAAMCRLISVVTNAVEVEFRDDGNDPLHLSAPLPPGKIAALKTPVPAIKGVKQPFASFGGSGAEAEDAFHTRVSERLRHKNRCITPWDYERIVLEAFPEIHKVKCIPHARRGGWLAPGNVLLVVVPDFRNRNSIDLLQPRVDSGTLSRIVEYVQRRTGMQVRVDAANPCFQKIRLDFRVAFRDGYEFNYQSGFLNTDLIRYLSPWAFDPTRDLSFGGKIYKSVLLDFIEGLDYVDYVTEFRMYSYTGEFTSIDISAAEPEWPDCILVSAEDHRIDRVKD